MKSSSRVALVGVLGGSLWLVACGHPGTAVQPNDIAVKDALARSQATCATDKPKVAKPIVVDLEDELRTELETTMKKGVVVVAYDCATIKVLRNCRVGGEDTPYEYGGVDPKEKVVSVKNQDELSVNVPMSSGKLGAEVSSGRGIDIAMIFRGQKTSTFDSVARTNLKPKEGSPNACDGATHFIRQATIGAFAVVTGSEGKVAAAAELMKIGASGSSEASRKSLLHDGKLEACSGAAKDGEDPVDFCRTPLILELQPILGEPVKEAKKDPSNKELPPPVAEASPCPDGFVFSQGKCMKASAQIAHTCDATDQSECKTQCEKGSAESCFNEGALLYKKDRDASYPFFEKACNGDVTDACGYQADILSKQPGSNADAEFGKKIERIASKGCDGGSGLACQALGKHYDYGPGKDLKKARRSFRRACIFGEVDGCTHAADSYRESEPGIEPDFTQALEYGKRGCSDPTAFSCLSLAEVYLDKRAGAVRNEAKGMAILDAQCGTKDSTDCSLALLLVSLSDGFDGVVLKAGEKYCAKNAALCGIPAGVYERGAEADHIAKNVPKAIALYEKACSAKDDSACDSARKLKAESTPAKPTKPTTPPKKPAKKK